MPEVAKAGEERQLRAGPLAWLIWRRRSADESRRRLPQRLISRVGGNVERGLGVVLNGQLQGLGGVVTVNQRSQAQGEVDSGADTGGCDDGAVHDDALRDWYRAQGTKVI